VAQRFKAEPSILARTKELVREEMQSIQPQLQAMKPALSGKKAAIYVGGGFKAFSLIKALKYLGMEVVLVGTQTGSKEDYQLLHEICADGTVIVDDTNPLELAQYAVMQGADLFIGGVKERPLAYKLGLAFCDHNHERKYPLAGYEGMLNFAQEVYNSITSPIWKLTPRYRQQPQITPTAGTDLSYPATPSAAGTDLSYPGNHTAGQTEDTINQSLQS